jgi:hypothetical protein
LPIGEPGKDGALGVASEFCAALVEFCAFGTGDIPGGRGFSMLFLSQTMTGFERSESLFVALTQGFVVVVIADQLHVANRTQER